MRLAAAVLFSSLAFSQGREGSSDRIVIVGYIHDDCPIPVDGTVSLIAPGSGEVVGVARPGGSNGKVTFEDVPRRAYQLRINVRFASEDVRAIVPNQGNTLDFGTIDVHRSMSCDIETVTIPSSAMLKAPPPQNEPIDTTICEILKDPFQFQRKLVRVRAVATGPVIDSGDGLSDQSCHRGMALVMPERSQDYKIRQLEEVIHSVPNKKTVSLGLGAFGVFVGRVSYVLMLSSLGENYVSFELAEVEELEPLRRSAPAKK